MTPPRRWPRQAEECRTGAIRRAREGKRRAEWLKGQIVNAGQREAATDIIVVFTEIELLMTQAKEGSE